MSALHVRDVPEPVMAALRERATRHGRSVQQEVRQILAAAAVEPAAGTTSEPLRLTTVRTSVTSRWAREEIYGAAGR